MNHHATTIDIADIRRIQRLLDALELGSSNPNAGVWAAEIRGLIAVDADPEEPPPDDPPEIEEGEPDSVEEEVHACREG